MSFLPNDVHNALNTLLQGLQSPDNVTRSQAEENLNNEWVNVRPAELLMGLVEQAQGSQDANTRSFAAVLFRRMATRTRKEPDSELSNEVFMTLTSDQQLAIRSKLLEALANETNDNARNKIGDAVAEIARQYVAQDEAWQDLLHTLFRLSNSDNAGQRENAFRVFAATPDVIEKQHEDAVQNVFTRGLKDQTLSVRLAAVEAFASFFQNLTKGAQKKYYKLVGDILAVLPPVKDTKDTEQLTRALIAFIDLAESQPKMFKDQFHDLVVFSIGVIQDKELDDQVRQNALELMATFAEYAPVMCKKDSSYTSSMVTQCLSLMTDVGEGDDDAEEWNASEDLEVDESDMNHVAGEQCMDRLANKLGGQVLLPPTFNWLPQMMSSTSWRDRHASLMAISAISEGCRDLMIGELDKVLDLVIPALSDAHPRVRWAGCNALGQMSTDFATTMQEKYHQRVVPAILPVLQASEPRVQSHAAASLVNFCEEAEKEILEPYLDQLLSLLLNLLQSPKRFVQEQALSTIATVADSAEAAFARYYSTLMPLLFNVLREVQDKEYRLLRAKAMECATLIAVAVGKEKMGQDALALVQLLGSIQEGITDADDPQASYLLHCWGRMCRVLGAEFIPYLPAVIQPLMQLASAKADIQLLDDEDEVARIESEEGWELVPLKGKFIGIKTSTLDDKNTAIELIAVYAQNLEAAFAPYVPKIMEEIALPGLAFFFHDPVRVASAKAIPPLLESTKKAHGDKSPELQDLWAKTVEKVLEVLTNEPTIETLADMYQCFYECVELMGKDCLNSNQLGTFITSAETVLQDYQSRVKARAEERAEDAPAKNTNGVLSGADDDEDEPSEDMLLAIEDDATLLSDMNKAFHAITKTHTTAFLPHWERLMSYYTSFANSPNSDSTQRQWALCIYDDVLEFCGPESARYQQVVLPALAAGVQDANAANRQAACYGVGVAAQKGGEPWSQFAAECLEPLFNVCAKSDARDEEQVFATENASAAITKILRFNSSKVPNPERIVEAWINAANTLPINNDEEAAPYAYMFVAELIEKGNPVVATQGVPARLFANVASALEGETIQGATAQRVAAATKTLLEQTGTDAAAILNSMTPEMQNVVQKWFS